MCYTFDIYSAGPQSAEQSTFVYGAVCVNRHFRSGRNNCLAENTGKEGEIG